MKKLAASLALILSFGYIAIHAAPTRYTQLNPAAQQSGGFNVNTGTITYATLTNAHIVNATIDSGGGGSGLDEHNGSVYGGTGSGTGVTGADNVGIGLGAMGGCSGSQLVSFSNTAVGVGALSLCGYSTFNGDGNNTAIGTHALQVDVTGWQNTAVGAYAGKDITDGYENTMVGYQAMGNGTASGNHSVSIGAYSLMGSAGLANIAIGHSAGSQSGENAGHGQTSVMNFGVMLGYDATVISPFANPTQVVQNSIALGALATANCHDCMVIGRNDSQMRVGIGTILSTSTIRGALNIIPHLDSIGTAAIDSMKYSLIIATADLVNQYDLAVSTSGVVAPRILQLTTLTSAQIKATTPNASYIGGVTGQEYYCSDCATVAVCISTGTAQGAFALITNKGSACQ